jgi:thiopeptide-type bacteriocin biosynthesis protein
MKREWLYVRLYPKDWTGLDRTVTHSARLARQDALRLGADRWFFIRYHDSSGPHVRLRVRASTDDLNAIHRAWCTRFRDDLESFTFAPYEPELADYGGELGVELAERAFQVSSEAALALTALSAKPLVRLAVTSLTMRELVREAASATAPEFWSTHRSYWSGRTPRTGDPTPLDPRLEGAHIELESTLRSNRVVASHISAIAAAVCLAIESAARQQVQLPAAQLLLRQVHMTVNRLGILPHQELRLGCLINRRSPTTLAAVGC